MKIPVSPGDKFGRLTVIDLSGYRTFGVKTKCKRKVWKCQCECGNFIDVVQNSFVTGNTSSCGCIKKELLSIRGKQSATDIIGVRCGMLTVTAPTDKRSSTGRVLWECLCDCGEKTHAYYCGLTNGIQKLSRKSCGCSTIEMTASAKITHGYSRRRNGSEPLYSMWCSAKVRAKKSNTKFDLDLSEFYVWASDLLEKRSWICPVLGVKMEHNKGVRRSNSVSLDRIVPALGYVLGNIDLISHRANQIKNDASLEEMKSVMRYVESCMLVTKTSDQGNLQEFWQRGFERTLVAEIAVGVIRLP